MDINLPGINGIDATRQITTADNSPVVMLLSTYESGDLPFDYDGCGAAAYVHKERFGPDVIRDVWADHTGQ
jgi:DNA-binding NarL/FixJ family response regulator